MADPYTVLGVRRDAPDAEVRAAYRRLVKRHHPDHNQGSEESEQRFEEVQEAYAEIQRLRAHSPRPRAPRTAPPPPGPTDSDLESRLAALEHQVQQARKARDKAQAAAREAARAAREAAETVRAAAGPDGDKRPTDEELGYVTTDDTIGKILSDARSRLADGYDKAREHPVARRVSELIDGLEELTEKLDRPTRRPPKS